MKQGTHRRVAYTSLRTASVADLDSEWADMQASVPPCGNCGGKVEPEKPPTIWYICKACRSCSPAVFARRTRSVG